MGNIMNNMKIDAVGEIENITMGSAAVALSKMLDSRVDITTPAVQLCKAGTLEDDHNEPMIYVKINYISGVKGASLLMLKQSDVQLFINKLMGMPLEVSEDFEFDEIKLSAVCEIMNQMMGASATALSEMLGVTVDISTPEAVVANDSKQFLELQNIDASDEICSVKFDLTVEGLTTSTFVTILSIQLADEMSTKMLINMGMSPEDINPPDTSSPAAENPPVPFNDETILTNLQIDSIGELQNITMGSAATALSNMLGSKVWITTPRVNVSKAKDCSFNDLYPSVYVKIRYIAGVEGTSVLVLKQRDVQLMINKLMGMPAEYDENFEFDEISMSAVCEIMNQMMGSAATALSEIVGKMVDISTPDAVLSSEGKQLLFELNNVDPDDTVAVVSFELTIDDLVESKFITLLNIDLAKEMADKMLASYAGALSDDGPSAPPADVPVTPPPAPEPAPAVSNAVKTDAVSAPQPSPVQPYPEPGQQPPQQSPYPNQQPQPPYPNQPQQQPTYTNQQQQYQNPPQQYPYQNPPQQPSYPNQPYTQPYPNQYVPPYGYPMYPPYPPYQPYPPYPQENTPDNSSKDMGAYSSDYQKLPKKQQDNLQMLMNVPLTVSVRIGSTKRRIEDILEFSAGTVVELDKQAGSPVDVVVNGNLIAKGEVVVIDDNFAIRIVEIVKSKLLDTLGKKE